MSNTPITQGQNIIGATAYAGPIPALPAPGAAANTDDLFAQLLELRWKDISIPYVRLATRLRQDLAVHKFADRDGAHIEGTGRAPLEITARLPMINGLQSAPSEHWQRPLYPFSWRKLFAAAADKRAGVLQHPELGSLTCKLESMDTVWEGTVRGGVWVDIAWIESDDVGIELENAIAAPSPLASARAAAGDLDSQLATVNPSITPQLPQLQFSFTAMMTSIRAVVDQTTILQQSTAGQIQNMIYEAQLLEDSLGRAANANALNWPMLQACERAKSACYDIQATQLTTGRTIGLFTVPQDMTLGRVANSIPAPIADVMILNPFYITSPIVSAGTVVRYYVAAA